jgi:hypothetical protein
VGAVVDLPYLSVMVMGLDDWPTTYSEVINEPRLLAAVRRQLGAQVQALRTPPLEADTGGLVMNPFDPASSVGVPVATFPRWMVCSYCRLLAPVSDGLFELKTEPYRPDRTRYVHRNCTRPGAPPEALPARFVVACEKGHIDDFPWLWFVHQGGSGCRGPLRLFELGPSGEAADVVVKCEGCDRSPAMSAAFSEEGRDRMPLCRGRRPQLRDFEADGCDQQMKTMLLGASNSWFPVVPSALSIPVGEDRLSQLVNQHWGVLERVTNKDTLRLLRDAGGLRDFAAYTDDQLWEAIERRRQEGGEGPPRKGDLKAPEWEVLSRPDPGRNSRDFQLRSVEVPQGYRQYFERVVLVDRLREVRALIGFTRIDAPGEDFETPRAPLSRSAPQWVPATEIRGEGIFVQFSEAAVRNWLARCQRLNNEFLEAHRRWRQVRRMDPDIGYPGLRYVLLHSFAHALIRQLALECGYATASIRERIYCRDPGENGEAMAGVLLYTAAPDSEGTLGGLVSLGRADVFERQLDEALQSLTLCASDPLCAENRPYREQLALHGAACHGCLFVPETSCERGNRYLDRTVLVRTLEREDFAFFDFEP